MRTVSAFLRKGTVPLLPGRFKGRILFVSIGLALLLRTLFLEVSSTAAATRPDPVLEWIGVMNDTVITAGTNPLATSRVVALVSASVYDTVNGIDPEFQPLHVKPNAPPWASQRVAAIQSAYVMLLHLYSQQAANLAGHQAISIGELTQHEPVDAIFSCWNSCPSGISVGPFDGERGRSICSRRGVWREHRLQRYVGCEVGHADICKFCGGCFGDC